MQLQRQNIFMKLKVRCPWPNNNKLMIKYHDEEWGVPVHNDRKIFEFMVLDAFQAGLSWQTIINKRKNFEKAFDNFNYKKIAKYGKREYNWLIRDAGIIRNKSKITAAIKNAQLFMEVQKEFGTFNEYIWQFVNHKPTIRKVRGPKDFRATSKESDAMSKDLKKRGFQFVGSTICYAFMQAAGMINDHFVTCFRYRQLIKMK